MSTAATSTQFLPLDRSLEDDAPGYVAAVSDAAVGPSCWKCSGSGRVPQRRPNRRERKRARRAAGGVVAATTAAPLAAAAADATRPCTVCSGSGRLALKKDYHAASPRPGRITDAARRRGASWVVRGPPAAFSAAAMQGGDAGVAALPAALRPRVGEALCCLTGDWRVYQRDGGHRWSTDDMVTSWVAGRTLRDVLLPAAAAAASGAPLALRYLDLGCGIGSVLMMTTWQALTYAAEEEECGSDGGGGACPAIATLECVGIEARAEAVDQARRSIHFNVGDGSNASATALAASSGGVAPSLTVLHGDFRTLEPTNNNAAKAADGTAAPPLAPLLARRGGDGFDLITGTPPYFEVQFDARDGEAVAVTAREGSLPSCKQSAPARCEFRGGIESYCAAAAAMLSDAAHARFVVCEGSLRRNRERVVNAALASGLTIDSVVDVIGKEGKEPLFAVFVMRRTASIASSSVVSADAPKHERVVIRQRDGARTPAYQQLLLSMGCPP